MKDLKDILLGNATKTYERKNSWEISQELGKFNRAELPNGIRMFPVMGGYGLQMKVIVGNTVCYYKIIDCYSLEEAMEIADWRLDTWECVLGNAERNYVLGAQYNWMSPA